MYIHIDSKHRNYTYKCFQCGHESPTKNALENHIRMRHRNYKCQTCEKTFTLKSALDKHSIHYGHTQEHEITVDFGSLI